MEHPGQQLCFIIAGREIFLISFSSSYSSFNLSKKLVHIHDYRCSGFVIGQLFMFATCPGSHQILDFKVVIFFQSLKNF